MDDKKSYLIKNYSIGVDPAFPDAERTVETTIDSETGDVVGMREIQQKPPIGLMASPYNALSITLNKSRAHGPSEISPETQAAINRRVDRIERLRDKLRPVKTHHAEDPKTGKPMPIKRAEPKRLPGESARQWKKRVKQECREMRGEEA